MKPRLQDSRASQPASPGIVEHSLLAAAVEQAADGVVLTDASGIIQYVNPAFTEMTGYGREEAVGQNPRILKSGLHSEPFYKQIWSTILSGGVWQGELTNRRKDGSFYVESMRIAPVRDGSGATTGYIAIKHDGTEQRASLESQALLAAIVEHSDDSIIACSPAGIVLSFNHGAETVFGYSSKEVIGKHMSMLVPMEGRVDLEHLADTLRRGGSTLQNEGICQRKDGSRIIVSVSGFPITNAAGEVVAISGILRDISEQKLLDRRLRESEERFRSMADSSPSMMWVCNAEGEFEFINRVYREFSAMTCEDVQAGKWRLLVHPDDAPAYLTAFDRAIRERTSFSAEGRVRRADGAWRMIGSRGEPRFSPRGEYLGHIGLRADITERKKAEKEKQLQHSLIRAIYEGSPDGILVVNENMEIASHNKRFFLVWGIPATEIVGTVQAPRKGAPIEPLLASALSLVKHPEEFLARLQDIFADPDRNENCEIEMKDGRTLERYSTCLRNERGIYMARVLFYRDITERKRAEMALIESENRFRQLTENLDEVFWLKTPESEGFLYISPAYEQVWERSCASVHQDPASLLEAIHPDDLAQSRLMFARQMQGEAVESEYRIRTLAGREKWILDRAFPIRDRDGKLIRVAGIAEDITERKLHEQELIRAKVEAEAASLWRSDQHAILDNERKMLRTIIDNVPDFMYVKDLEGRFVVANTVLAQLMGAEKPNDLLGKTDFDFYPRELATHFFEDEQQVIQSGEPMIDSEETVGENSTNGVRYVLTTKVPLFDGEGRVTRIAGIGRDITMRKMMEDALRESNQDLREATDWAHKMALEAEAANRSKSEFLANMSHEIRTPMNGVLGMNGLLLGSKLNPEQRHYAEVVDASAKALLTVIDDILDFSKVEAGKLEIDTIDFNLHVLMGDFGEMMAGRIGEKHLEFICAVAPDIPSHLQGDPGRLRQVLLNLASNAIKFTPHGEVAVRVALISETDGEVFLRFSVRDTGIGIPKNKQHMLFTSFTQVDASTTRQYGGTGLGLAISKKLVELMGGKIGLESEQGKGSEFWFTIHFAKQPANLEVDYPKVQVKGSRILVVDDNATNREVLSAQLQSWGAVMAAVESGSTALTCLRYAVATGTPFELAILDMMMPGMDGEALGRAILADETLQDTQLVLMSSMGQRGDAHRFKEIGFAAYLVKPVRPSDLYDCLVTVLTGEKQKETRAIITRHSLRESRRGNARILLVEDNLTNQEVASGMLRRLGWTADVAPNGKQALLMLETRSYDLVLMDVQMPEMDGYEATRLIRDPRSPVLNHNIPIIATTAHAMAGDAETCLAAGMSDYISKPIDPKILGKLVEKWLARKVHSESAEAPFESAADSAVTPPKPPSGPPVFNRGAFLERMMGDEEFAREVAAGFVNELPSLLSAMREEFARGDLESIWKQAHKIKGSAANVGGEALRDVASEVEQAGKAGDLAAVTRCIPALELHAARLNEALKQWAN